MLAYHLGQRTLGRYQVAPAQPVVSDVAQIETCRDLRVARTRHLCGRVSHQGPETGKMTPEQGDSMAVWE